MKITKGKIILIIIVIYFSFMGYKNISKEKDNNNLLLDQVTIVSDGKVDSDNDGKLVLVTGKISYDGNISFIELGKQFDTFKVERIVEDYKKVETTSGNFSNKWVKRKKEIESDDYLYLITSETKCLDTKIGEFSIDDIGMSKVDANELFIDREIKIGNLQFDGLAYSDLDHKDNEQIGDMRIKYFYYNTDKNKYISILAEQHGDSFIPYKIDKKTEIYNVYNGRIDTIEKLKDKLNSETKSNASGKILFILMIIGAGTFFILDSKKK